MEGAYLNGRFTKLLSDLEYTSVLVTVIQIPVSLIKDLKNMVKSNGIT